MSKTFANVIVDGTAEQIGLVETALNGVENLGGRLEELLKRAYIIEFHTPAEFTEAGFVLSSGKPAWGYVAGPRKLWINSSLAKKRPWRAKYTILHEIAHGIAADYLTSEKRQALMKLMVRTGGTTPTRWNSGKYRNRPGEIYADAFTEATGFESPLDDFYGDVADENLPKLVEITFRPDPAPVEPEPPPEPLPPPDPLKELEDRLKAIGGKANEIVALASEEA